MEKVEKAELRTSRSLIEEITSLEHIEVARLPSIERNHLNFKIRTVFLCDEELILYAQYGLTRTSCLSKKELIY